MRLTAHVLIVWKTSTTNGASPKSEAVYSYIEHGNDDLAWKTARELARRYEMIGKPIELVTVSVDSSTPNPAGHAAAAALFKSSGQHVGYATELLLSPVSEGQARAIGVHEAVMYLKTVHDLHVDPNDDGWGLVLLRLARRARYHDSFAELALTEIAYENRRANSNVSPNVEPLTSVNIGRWAE